MNCSSKPEGGRVGAVLSVLVVLEECKFVKFILNLGIIGGALAF